MRPINLIPEQQRKRQGGAGRTGPLAFLVVGALLVALAGVVALVLTSNQISERESEVSSLKTRADLARARADRLSPFASFDEVKEQRTRTVSELADNRVDWARVLHELSLIMPRFVMLKYISGSAGGGGGGGENSLASAIAGPSLTVEGCGKSQTKVAQMVAALNRIDGVTRVGLAASGPSIEEGESDESTFRCPGKYLTFSIVAAFDGAPLPVDPSETVEAEPASEAETSDSGGEEESSTSTSVEGSTETTVSTETIPPES